MTSPPHLHTAAASPNLDRSVDPGVPAALTELAAALEALAAAQQVAAAATELQMRATAVLDLLPDACLLTDPTGIIHETNRATSSLIGFARRYAVGKPLGGFVAPTGQDALARTLATLSAHPTPAARPTTLTLPFRPTTTSPERTVRVWVRPLAGVGGLPQARLWLLRDISSETNLATAYAQLQADQAQQLRTRTMELEAVLRMRDATLVAERTALATLVAHATAPTAEPPATVLAQLVAGLQQLLLDRTTEPLA